MEGDGGRQREMEGDGGRQREMEGDRGRWRETEGDGGRANLLAGSRDRVTLSLVPVLGELLALLLVLPLVLGREEWVARGGGGWREA